MTLIVFIIVLGLLVFVHEFGHFFIAKRNGVKVKEFGFGFPPRVLGFRKVDGKYKIFFGNKDVDSEDTIYSLNWIPLGGFVKIKGEQGEAPDDPDSFSNKKPWQRFKILVAGVLMNFVLGFVFLSIGFMAGLPTAIDEVNNLDNVKDIKVQVMSVQKNSPADKAGLKMTDTILSINDVKVKSVKDVQSLIKNSKGKVKIEFIQGNQKITKIIEPKQTEQGRIIGVSLVRTGRISYPWYIAIYQGFKTTLFMIIQIFIGIFILLKNLIFGQGLGMEVAGPVGIAVLTGQIAKQGIVQLMQFVAVLSINLGVLNLLPFPALDGGHILFLIIEKIRRKPVSQRIAGIVNMVGFILLLTLMVFVTFKDVSRFW